MESKIAYYLLLGYPAKMHRIGLAQETSTSDGSMNGAICRKVRAPKIKKKWQITDGKSGNDFFRYRLLADWIIRIMLYSSFKRISVGRTRLGYLMAQKIAVYGNSTFYLSSVNTQCRSWGGAISRESSGSR